MFENKNTLKAFKPLTLEDRITTLRMHHIKSLSIDHFEISNSFHSFGETNSNCRRSQSFLVRGMNIEEKLETQYVLSEESFGGIRFPYFEPFSPSVFPTQSGNHQAFHHQAASRISTNTNYGIPQDTIYGKSQATVAISSFVDSHPKYIGREGIAKSNTTSNDMEGDLLASWGQLAGSELHERSQSDLGSWMGTRSFHSNLQSGGGACEKQRIRWTHELHELFVDAVNNLGGPMKATPKGILKLMKSPGLTVFHIKSHLQKYRSAKCSQEGRNGTRINCDGMPLSSLRGYGGIHMSETLRLQMDVQKSLHEHLEFQKKLQMKIEEHANYLQQMFNQQKRTRSYFENQNSNTAADPSLAECSSARVYEDHGNIFLNEPQS